MASPRLKGDSGNNARGGPRLLPNSPTQTVWDKTFAYLLRCSDLFQRMPVSEAVTLLAVLRVMDVNGEDEVRIAEVRQWLPWRYTTITNHIRNLGPADRRHPKRRGVFDIRDNPENAKEHLVRLSTKGRSLVAQWRTLLAAPVKDGGLPE